MTCSGGTTTRIALEVPIVNDQFSRLAHPEPAQAAAPSPMAGNQGTVRKGLRRLCCQPAQLRRPIAGMQSRSRSRVDRCFIELLAQLYRCSTRTCIFPEDQWCERTIVGIDSHEAMPEGIYCHCADVFC